jgi:hypothetical protein
MRGETTQYTAYIKLPSNINMLRFENWSVEANIHYGYENIRKLYEKLHVDERWVIRGFRE